MSYSLDFAANNYSIAATTLTEVYSCPAGKTVRISLFICNRGAAATFRLAIARKGVADSLSHYLYYDSALAANETKEQTDITLSEGDEVRIYCSTANFSVNPVVQEVRQLVESY